MANGTHRWHRPLPLVLALAALLAGPVVLTPAVAAPAAAHDAPPGAPDLSAPDLSAVTSAAAARRLVRAGRLVEISLFPTELGGPEDAHNISYTTPEAAAAREAVIAMLEAQLDRGLIDRMQVAPEYKGDSIVPSRIAFAARHSERGGGIAVTLEVW